MQNEFSVIIVAEDIGASTVLHSTIAVPLIVRRSLITDQLYESPPSFVSGKYFGVVEEGRPEGEFVLQVNKI